MNQELIESLEHVAFDSNAEGAAVIADAIKYIQQLESEPQASAAQSAPTEPKPTSLSRGWNLVRQCDGFVIGHSADEPKENHKQKALDDGRVYVPFMVEQSAPVGEREAFRSAVLAKYPNTTFQVKHDGSYLGWIDDAFWGFQAGAAWQRAQSAGVPEGWRLVPVEPTPEMVIAGNYSWGFSLPDSEPVYAAMIAAAPAQPAAQDQGEVQRLKIALRLSANRFDRLALEFPNASDMRWTASEWANEARSALAASTGQEV